MKIYAFEKNFLVLNDILRRLYDTDVLSRLRKEKDLDVPFVLEWTGDNFYFSGIANGRKDVQTITDPGDKESLTHFFLDLRTWKKCAEVGKEIHKTGITNSYFFDRPAGDFEFYYSYILDLIVYNYDGDSTYYMLREETPFEREFYDVCRTLHGEEDNVKKTHCNKNYSMRIEHFAWCKLLGMFANEVDRKRYKKIDYLLWKEFKRLKGDVTIFFKDFYLRIDENNLLADPGDTGYSNVLRYDNDFAQFLLEHFDIVDDTPVNKDIVNLLNHYLGTSEMKYPISYSDDFEYYLTAKGHIIRFANNRNMDCFWITKPYDTNQLYNIKSAVKHHFRSPINNRETVELLKSFLPGGYQISADVYEKLQRSKDIYIMEVSTGVLIGGVISPSITKIIYSCVKYKDIYDKFHYPEPSVTTKALSDLISKVPTSSYSYFSPKDETTLMNIYNGCSSSITNSSINVCQVDTPNKNKAVYKINTKKESNKMNKMFNFEFGPVRGAEIAMSMYGPAIKNHMGTYVAYDTNSSSLIDVDILNFKNDKMFFRIPVALKDIAVGDMVVHNGKFMIVTGNTGTEVGSISVIDPAAGEEKMILPTKNMFGFNFYTKIMSPFSGFMADANASADNPFGNMMLPLMFMGDEGMSFKDMMPLMFFMGGENGVFGGMDKSNPLAMMMMFSMLSDDKENSLPW